MKVNKYIKNCNRLPMDIPKAYGNGEELNPSPPHSHPYKVTNNLSSIHNKEINISHVTRSQ